MSSLFASLQTSAGALSAFERALEVTQNNVSNANTPGYARQRITLEALPFQPEQGLPGGVLAGEIASARDRFAEQEVRRKLESLGDSEQRASSLAAIENTLDISAQGGISAALSQFFQSFSALSVTPNDSGLRQAAIDSAQALAQAFQRSAAGLDRASADTDLQIGQVVAHVNDAAAKLREYNAERLRNSGPDAGLDAKLHAALEELSEFANFDAVPQADGTVTVLLGGQTPLVIGDRQFAISNDFASPTTPPPVNSNAPPAAIIRDAQGRDITAEISGGKLGGLLDTRNRVLPSLAGDAYRAGDLNRLAKALADRVNQILTAGRISDGPPPQSGVALFTYTAGNDTDVARSLAVNPAATPGQLATIDPGPPYSSNGVARKLAGLLNSSASADQIDGANYVEFYGGIAARVGRELSGARDGADLGRQLVAQAHSLRDQISGVSLDEEAVHLVEFQRSFQATAKMITVLDDLTSTVVNLVR